jgi:hypothetical protein
MGIHVNKKAASTRKMVRIPVIKKSTSFGCNTSLCVYIDVIRLYSSSSKRLFTCPIVKVIYSLVYTYKLNYLFPISILFKYVHVLYCTLVCVCLSVYSCHDDMLHMLHMIHLKKSTREDRSFFQPFFSKSRKIFYKKK